MVSRTSQELPRPEYLSIREIHHRADTIRTHWDAHEMCVRRVRALEAQAKLFKIAMAFEAASSDQENS